MSLRTDLGSLERIRRFWNIDLPDGIDLSCTEHSPVARRFDAGRNEQFWTRPESVASTIGEPQPVLDFDLHTPESLDSLDTDHLIERTASADTIVDSCCIWFEAVFDDATTLSTSPLAPWAAEAASPSRHRDDFSCAPARRSC